MTTQIGSSAYLGSGQEVDAILVTNTSSTTCSIGGYPSISFYGATSTASGLVSNYAIPTAYMDVPTAFQQVTPTTTTDLESGQSAALYYTYNSRATSSDCVMLDDAIDISWTGSVGSVQYPANTGAYSIEACAGAQVTFSPLGPAATSLLVPGPANGS
jgi:hypothetical protein